MLEVTTGRRDWGSCTYQRGVDLSTAWRPITIRRFGIMKVEKLHLVSYDDAIFHGKDRPSP